MREPLATAILQGHPVAEPSLYGPIPVMTTLSESIFQQHSHHLPTSAKLGNAGFKETAMDRLEPKWP